MLQDARAGPDPRIGPAGRALILLDTVEEWGDTVDLLTPGILNKHGLGDENEPVPVVMAFRAGAGGHDALFGKLIELADREPWIEAAKVEPLAEGDEEGLAYRWILLNANPAVAPPVSERIYTVVKPRRAVAEMVRSRHRAGSGEAVGRATSTEPSIAVRG